MTKISIKMNKKKKIFTMKFLFLICKKMLNDKFKIENNYLFLT